MRTVKTCRDCGIEKPVNDFYLRDGRPRSACKPCWSNRTRSDRQANPEKYRGYAKDTYTTDRRYWSHILEKYGLTREDYELRLFEQGGVCKACGGSPTGRGRLHVDHDHETGVVRGLLCFGCNLALGNVADDIERLRMLIAYLEVGVTC